MLGALLLLALAQDPDEVGEQLARAKKIDACWAAYLPARKVFPTAYLRGTSTDAATCTRRVMNREIDALLLPLKKSGPALFKRGMDAQREFNDAVKRYCGRWSAWYGQCCATCSYTEEPECEMDFHGARVKQVQAAIAKSAPAEVSAPTRPRTSEFTAYATEWCAFLGEHGVAVDAQCGARVLGALEQGQRDKGAELSCKAQGKE